MKSIPDADDPADQLRKIDHWLKAVKRQNEPVIWAWLADVLQRHDILTCPLAEDMVINLHAIADLYGSRLAQAK